MSRITPDARTHRGHYLPPGLAQHILGERVDVLHACPLCGVTNTPNPLCEVCLGAGSVSTDRLDRYQADLIRQAGGLF